MAPGGTAAAARIEALGFDPAALAHEAVPACNLCGSTDPPRELARRDRYGYPVRSVACRRCGLVYLSPRLAAAGYARFYESVYRPLVSAYHGRRIDAETLPAEQRAYAADLAAYLAPHLPGPPATILDVGGSTGTVAAALAARLGGRATVLDPAPAELAVARAAGLEAVAGFAEDFDAGGRTWDLVLLCQAVDHLLDVAATLAALAAMTAPGGRAFVDIVDLDLVVARVGAMERAAKIDHPYYLTGATARAYFAGAGFEVVDEAVAAADHRRFVLLPAR